MYSKKLFEILPNDPRIKVVGSDQARVNRLVLDSRAVKPGEAFIAMKGLVVDGHNYIGSAVERGASVVFCEELPKDIHDHITYVCWSKPQQKLADLASRFYDNPSQSLRLVGVTGTNGKSTVVVLLHQLFTGLGYKAGLISTIKYQFGEHEEVATHTTPDIIKVNELLARMRDTGCEYAFMEVSSHGIDQGRVQGLTFSQGVFTNLSQDHLDYHKTYNDYVLTKKKFFDILNEDAIALVNADDKQAEFMVQHTQAEHKTYALRRMADYKVRIIANEISGLHLEINTAEVFVRLRGAYNAYNLAAVYGVAREFDISKEEILPVLSGLHGAEGRFDYSHNPESGKSAIVDYAHTPDAVENLLKNVKEMKRAKAQVITVIGCGGDRDKGKRPKMAAIAEKYSDILILTSDNPRSEKPESILDDMEKGLVKNKKYLRIVNRKEAIKTGVMLAASGDIIVVAGKGHEKYQEINGEKLPFDDKQIITSTL